MRQNTIFSKVVRIGGQRLYTDSPYAVSVHCKIVLNKRERDGKECLSITGVIGPRKNGDCLGSCGQIYDSIAIHSFAPKWNEKLLAEFLSVWRRWHLNDMHAECSHQRELVWTWETHHAQPCPMCGYKLGREWKYEEIPESVIEFLKSLPATDKAPAWV